jgi:hypothetical protein
MAGKMNGRIIVQIGMWASVQVYGFNEHAVVVLGEGSAFETCSVAVGW